MRKSKQFLVKRDINDLVEALELIISEQMGKLNGLATMLVNLTEPELIDKAYAEIGHIVNSLVPVQYLVEQQAPSMKEVFKQYEGK